MKTEYKVFKKGYDSWELRSDEEDRFGGTCVATIYAKNDLEAKLRAFRISISHSFEISGIGRVSKGRCLIKVR